ncbi:collagen-like protein [Salinimicrobium flavum]|uniref:Collagen-like protein n=1 Tax=Salinimicrobium flavum TaxID=1737065 RepID=A0ABW5IZV5_9FLAO
MKKLTFLLGFIMFSFTACSDDGEMGPPGPQGPPGEPGVNILGQTFGDLTERDFTYDAEFNLYAHFLEIPGNVEVFESDAILAYRLEVISDVETWHLLPKTIFFDDGRMIQYSFNHTSEDVEVVITGNFDLDELEDVYTQGQYFKFVVVPSDFVEESSVDISNYQEVMDALNL